MDCDSGLSGTTDPARGPLLPHNGLKRDTPAQPHGTMTTTYSATYQTSPCEGGIVTFTTWEALDQWFETFGRYCYSVTFH